MSDGFKRILIVRPSAMGDIIMASCLVTGLKHFFPTSSIDWLVEPRFAEVIGHHSHLNKIILWDKASWSKRFKGLHLSTLLKDIAEFRRVLRFGASNSDQKPCYDLVVDAQGLLRSRVLSRLTGAKSRVGLKFKEPGGFLMTRLVTPPFDKFMGSEYLYLLSAVTGANLDSVRKVACPAVHVSVHCRAKAAELIRQHGVQRYAVFLPFTTRPQKHWVQHYWSELAKEFQELRYRVLILGGPNDRDAAQAIAEPCDNAVSLAGDVSLSTAFAVIQGASLAIGVDTGLTHAAVVSNVPTVALFGSTCPYLFSLNERLKVIFHGLTCAPCRRSPVCNGDFECMKSISVSEVMDAVVQIDTLSIK